ncbi:MAG: hypothetical protein HY744_32475 [Deltaproteobacteria bacterium]|nr:hypothetical protein [Deltaproteobacteria bacterium]
MAFNSVVRYARATACAALGTALLLGGCAAGRSRDGSGAEDAPLELAPLHQARADKIDLLLAIDNSRSMADKQQSLKLAVPALVDAETEPPIGNPELVAGCPAGRRRLLRLVGAGARTPGAGLFVGCR